MTDNPLARNRRLYGEWFRLTDEVYQLINELKAGTGQ